MCQSVSPKPLITRSANGLKCVTNQDPMGVGRTVCRKNNSWSRGHDLRAAPHAPRRTESGQGSASPSAPAKEHPRSTNNRAAPAPRKQPETAGRTKGNNKTESSSRQTQRASWFLSCNYCSKQIRGVENRDLSGLTAACSKRGFILRRACLLVSNVF